MSGGAMFWSETYSGGSITITIQATASTAGTPFQVYLFLKPTMWGISPQYNYTIPYESIYPPGDENDVISPQSSTSYLIIQWDPTWQPAAGVTGQWNVWIVSNPSGNNASITPNPSPNLGDVGVGWEGIGTVGTGFIYPNPGDRINITVTYNPSTNTLSGVAVDLNTGQSASFTLNLNGYYTPPTSGNYVFGVGAATFDYGGNGALLYVATTQQPTTPPPPSLSSLAVRVFNVLGRPATTVPGVVLGVLYNSSGFREVVYMNSSGYLNFYGVSPGTYILEVYHYPNTGLNLTEYWGGMTVNLQSGSNFVTFIRHEPWIYNLQVSASSGEIVVTVTVNGTVTSPTQGEIELWVTNNPSLASPYNPSKVFYFTINPGLNTFNFTYPVSQAGTYYVYAAVLTYISTYTVTDQWNWTATTIIQPPTPPTLPQNYQVVLNLLNGQQYFGVPHVYQGDNGGTPTNQWPVYYGPNNASQYWSQGNITSNQPVLELVPGQMSGGAMFWSETYSGGSITITVQATASEVFNGGTHFQVYLFLKPTMWGVSPQYNYSIPYESVGPGPAGGDVILPQSSTSYLIIQWDPTWQPAPTLDGSTGQWFVWIGSNPSGNNASVGPYPSPNLVSSIVGFGWDGIGTGYFQPNPGDRINITVTYNPSTNTLSGVAVDLNTGQSASFTLNLNGYYTPPTSGNYVFGVGAATYDLYGGNGALLYVATTQQLTTPPTPPTLPQNYQAVLNLLNGQQYFGVPHVYQGDNGGTPTNQWPVYYGPSTASQYWSQGGISSDQPVLELVPYSGWASGAMFWSETYSGGSVTITMVGTYSEGTTNPADGFEIYLFLKPTMWGIGPQYNYSIPYVASNIYTTGISPVQGDVMFPQSSGTYIVVEWNPLWQYARSTSGATGQWDVWLATNPNGITAYVDPYPSPNLGSSWVGWDGIGTGAFQPRPGDLINITVTYNPSTNTLSGVAYDMNTGQSASFTLNLNGYYTPPGSGSYVFGIAGNTGGAYANWALLYVAMMGNVKSPLPSPTYYSVNFTEVGLPPGTAWNVTLNGVTKASSNSSIIFTVPNGEYKYSVASPILVNGVEYVATKPSGTVTVNNANVTVIVQYVPITALLVVQVFNVLGRPATTVPGVVLGVLYNSSGFREVVYMNSSGYLNFYGVSPGTYTLEVYHYPNTGLNLTEYWGNETINVQPGYNVVNFTRDEPWIYNLQAVENGARITINVTVDDPLNAILHGELYIWVTTSPQTANPSEPTIDTSLTSITIGPGLNKFTYYYTATQEGTYYIYAALLIYNGTQLITTDQWNWTAVPKMYQLTFIIFSNALNVSFELYESNKNFSQGQIIASKEISGEGQTIPFNLPQGIYEYDLSLNSQDYTIAPSPTGFINLTENERIYLFVIPTSNSMTVNMIPVGLPDPSQWYVTYQDPFESLIFLPEKDGTILLSMLGLNTGANIVNLSVYSTNPQYYPLLPKVQINATTFKNNETYVVPFATAGNAHIVDWNGVQWSPLLNEYSQPNFGYAYGLYIPLINAYTKYYDGFCWGISSTAILYYLGILPLPSQSATTNQLFLGFIVHKKILIQYLPPKTKVVSSLANLTDASLAVAVHQIFDPNNYRVYETPANEIASIAINSIDNNQPVILIIRFTNQSGDSKYVGSGQHAVVAWGYVKEPNGDVVFLVYDPNYPQIITRAIYYTNGSFIYIDGGPPYSVIVNGQKFSYLGDVGKVIGVALPTPANLSWFKPSQIMSLLGSMPWVQLLTPQNYALYVSTSPLNVYTGGELVGYFIDNEYFVTASTVPLGDLAGYVDGYPWSPLYIVAVRNGFNAWVDPNSTLVALRFANASGTIMVYGFVVNSTGLVAVRFINQSSFIVASRNNTVVKLELFSVTNSSVRTYNTTLWLSNRTGYVVSANFTNLTNTTIKTVTVSWGNITPTQTATATTTTTTTAVSTVTSTTTVTSPTTTTVSSTVTSPVTTTVTSATTFIVTTTSPVMVTTTVFTTPSIIQTVIIALIIIIVVLAAALVAVMIRRR
jgi:hypothetical protein